MARKKFKVTTYTRKPRTQKSITLGGYYKDELEILTIGIPEDKLRYCFQENWPKDLDDFYYVDPSKPSLMIDSNTYQKAKEVNS